MNSIQICGTSGSGKTTLVRELMKQSNAAIAGRNEKGKVDMYSGLLTPENVFGSLGAMTFGLGPVEVLFLGSYETVCGGCDTIPSVKVVAAMLEDLAQSEDHFLVFFEGLMISHMVGTVGAAQKALPGKHVRAFLDTPLNVCLDRVLERRKARGQTKPFNPTNTQKDWPRVRQCRENCMKQGIPVYDLDHLNPLASMVPVLEDLWNV
jgi:hypothetical protein